MMKPPGTITFFADEADQRLGPMPVKVRSAKGEIVGTGVSGSPISVPPGRYFVSVVTPDGRERGRGESVTVKPGEDTVLATAVSRQAPASALPLVADAALAPAPAGAAPDTGAAPPADPEPGEIADARLWTGDWASAWGTGAAGPAERLAAGLGPVVALSERVPLIIGQAADLDRLLALSLPELTRYTVVPYDECTSCAGGGPAAREIAASLLIGKTGPQVRFRSTVSEETNTLLSFVDNGVLTEMIAVSEHLIQQGEAAMHGAGGSVLRAVTGAYVLLRGNALDGLATWLTTLAELSPDLPDVPVLRAELLARLGMHEDALAQLRIALAGRTPWFRSGLSYMLERLRLYVDVSANKKVPFQLGAEELRRFVEARDRLDRLMVFLVRGRVIATFDVPHTQSAAGAGVRRTAK